MACSPADLRSTAGASISGRPAFGLWVDKCCRAYSRAQHKGIARRVCGFLTEERSSIRSTHIPVCKKGLLYQQQACSRQLSTLLLSSGQPSRTAPLLAGSLLALELAETLFPRTSLAGERVPVQYFGTFLESIENLGAYGPLFFVATTTCLEVIPLLPTQPALIASGLLFGAPKGALCSLVGTSTAAVVSFQLSRRLGRRLAERVAAKEMSEEDKASGMFARVQEAIDSGSFQQQVIAVALLRLTPVVPFSASNYLLGATPLKFSAYLGGSLVGLSFWCAIYATLGGASRGLFKSGISLDVLLDDLLRQASTYTQDAGIALLVLGVLVLIAYQVGGLWQGEQSN